MHCTMCLNYGITISLERLIAWAFGFLLVFLLCCEDDREPVFMAVSDDPQFIKTLSSLVELHFKILYYLVYVLTWFVCLTESLRFFFVLYVKLFRTRGHSCNRTTFPLSLDLFLGDKQS